MAHTKSSGTTKLGRDSASKRLGVKLSDGEQAVAGNILIRQRGSKFLSGAVTRMGGDDTIYAIKKGTVKFTTRKKKNFDGSRRIAKVVHVV